MTLSLALTILSLVVSAHKDGCARDLGGLPDGVTILWISFLLTVALFRELAHHCTAYDEERTGPRARVLHSRNPTHC